MQRDPKPIHRRQRLVIGSAALLLSVAVVATTAVASARATGRHQSERSDRFLPYPVAGTMQGACYDDYQTIACPEEGEAYFGQDAQHGYFADYVLDGETVIDLVTDLTWQRVPGNKVTYAQAVAGARSLVLGGYDDWRLPTIKELYSLIDFRGVDPSGWQGTDTGELTPFISREYFGFEYGDVGAGERVIDAQYWSSTEYVSTTMDGDATVFGVNFADGRIKGYPRDRGPGGTAMTEFVRYVRGNPDYGKNDFVDNGDGTITDRATGLMWSRGDSGEGLNWREALAYAEGSTLAGHDDWHLPDAKQLQSIVDYTRSPATHGSAAIDPVFAATRIEDEGGDDNYASYWTSTTHLNMAPAPARNAVYVSFGEALGFMETPPNSGTRRLMDVHGAGAQRSDPKQGDPADWPDGRGPQGDVIRIYNYVRVVRTDPALSTPPTPTQHPQPTLATNAPETPSATPTKTVAPTETPDSVVGALFLPLLGRGG